jgi:protein SCO1
MKLKGLVIGLALSAVALATAQVDLTKNLRIDQKLGAQVPMDVPLTSEDGKTVKFGDVFSDRPVVFMPIFYQCKGVCSLELAEINKDAARMRNTFALGEKYDIVMLSIDPKETPTLAKIKKLQFVDQYIGPVSGSPIKSSSKDEPTEVLSKNAERGVHCLVGSYENIRKITDAVGFSYDYEPASDRINHPAGIMMLSPKGMVAGYIYGSEYPTKILQGNLELARLNRLAKPANVVLLGCIMVDPLTGKRTLMVKNALVITGCLTVLILGISIFKMSIDSKKGGQSPA